VELLHEVCREEQIEADDDAIRFIARLSDGGMRDALSLLDQIMAFSGQHVSYNDVISITGGMASEQFERLVQAIKQRDVGAVLQLVDGFMQEGKSADKCMENLLYYFRDLLMVKMVPNSQAVTDRIIDVKQFASVAESFTTQELISMMDTLNYYQTEMKYSVQPQTLLEVALMKLCSPSGSEAVSRAGFVADSAKSPDRAPEGLVAQLMGRIQRLEEQLTQLQKQGVAPASGASGGGQFNSGPRSPAIPAAMKKSVEKLDGFLEGKDSTEFKAVLQKWSQVLGRVKEQRITIHAWLVDGEPVSVHGDAVLVAFKSSMHRETTEKPANKQLIEQVIADITGNTYRLVTVMIKDWKAAADQAKPAEANKEELKLVHEDEPAGAPAKEEWISEAIQLFGEDLVKIKED
jgi:DNA polymerase-3 subunit gamma/tau